MLAGLVSLSIQMSNWVILEQMIWPEGLRVPRPSPGVFGQHLSDSEGICTLSDALMYRAFSLQTLPLLRAELGPTLS